MDKKYVARLWSRVDIRDPEECWPWTAGCFASGYGQIKILVDGKKRSMKSHRLIWAVANGQPLPGRWDFICHTCDNPPCCNPWHLFKGTPQDNAMDRDSKGRGSGGRPRTMPLRVKRKARPGASARPGSAHHGALLDELAIPEIFRLRTQRVRVVLIAKQFGVTTSAVYAVLSGRGWRHTGQPGTPPAPAGGVEG